MGTHVRIKDFKIKKKKISQMSVLSKVVVYSKSIAELESVTMR